MFLDKAKCLHFQTTENAKNVQNYFKLEKLNVCKKVK